MLSLHMLDHMYTSSTTHKSHMHYQLPNITLHLFHSLDYVSTSTPLHHHNRLSGVTAYTHALYYKLSFAQ
jgi:hypothetical protein